MNFRKIISLKYRTISSSQNPTGSIDSGAANSFSLSAPSDGGDRAGVSCGWEFLSTSGYPITQCLLLFLTFSLLAPIVSNAQTNTLPETKDWNFHVGGGFIAAPAFLGAKDYQLSLVPEFRVTYKDLFFASMVEGIGYNLLNQDGWKAGPLAKLAYQRRENGDAPFRIAGSKSSALQGLGDVDTTLELGGFAKYTWHEWSAKAELRQGVNGHKGLVFDLTGDYARDIHTLFYEEGRRIFVAAGPRARFVNDSYNEKYFGIDSVQSQNSGLPQYSAKGGLLFYGIGTSVTVPIDRRWSITTIAGYNRLAQDAADSPLVTKRGSPDQFILGTFASYRF